MSRNENEVRKKRCETNAKPVRYSSQYRRAAPIKFVCILSKKEATVRRASKKSRRRERKRKMQKRGGANKGRQTAKNKDETENAHRAAAGEEQR